MSEPSPAHITTDPRHGGGKVVLLAGPGYSTDIVASYLASRVPRLVVVLENGQPRMEMARRRARRVGWPTVVGQVLFVALLQPVLRALGTRRRNGILRTASLDTTNRAPSVRVRSVNDDEVVALLRSLRPDVVVVHGTRIISARVLASAGCPVVNMHAGITPRYRGVHGGYWALAEHHPEWVGTTIHLVDAGIDTGGILAQATFEVSGEDTIATYPDLHLVHGLPLLAHQVENVMAGLELKPRPGLAPGTALYYHPTLWGYLWHRWRHGVR
jgi:folate-dependent phosphoribosylglycinamide formyltransferase PurN